MTTTPTCPFCRYPLAAGRCPRCERLVMADSGLAWDSSALIAAFASDADLGWENDTADWLAAEWKRIEPDGPSLVWIDGQAAPGYRVDLAQPEAAAWPFRLGEAVPLDTPEATKVRVIHEPCPLTDQQRADSDRLLRLVWPNETAGTP